MRPIFFGPLFSYHRGYALAGPGGGYHSRHSALWLLLAMNIRTENVWRKNLETLKCELGGVTTCCVLGTWTWCLSTVGPAHHIAHSLGLEVDVAHGCPSGCQEWVQPPLGTPTTQTVPSQQEAGTQLSANGKENVTGGQLSGTHLQRAQHRFL